MVARARGGFAGEEVFAAEFFDEAAGALGAAGVREEGAEVGGDALGIGGDAGGFETAGGEFVAVGGGGEEEDQKREWEEVGAGGHYGFCGALVELDRGMIAGWQTPWESRPTRASGQ